MNTNRTINNTMSLKFIESVLAELAEKRPLFWSEADFQFAFAWMLKKSLGENAEIFLERRYEATVEYVKDGETIKELEKFYIDIVVKYLGKFYPIELKYKTRESNYDEIVTASQSANDLGRYFYLWDIYRLEKLCDQQEDFGEGYAIMLTNDANYYLAPRNTTSKVAVDHNFRLHPRNNDLDTFPIPGKVSWDLSRMKDTNTKESWTKRHPNFELSRECELDWKPYSLEDANKLGLKYLINVVSK